MKHKDSFSHAMLVALAVTPFFLAGCQKQATGQVAAVVNGDEVTLQEVNAEIAGAQIPASADKQVVQRAALQQIVDRRLLASAARDGGMNKTAEYLIQQRKLDDVLLIQLLSQQIAKTIKVPTAAEADKFITTNPWMFADRQILTFQRIRFPAQAGDATIKALIPIHAMDGIAAKLTTLNIPFQRDDPKIDTAILGKPMLDRVNSLPQGEPLIVPEGDVVSVYVKSSGSPAPLIGDQARPLAVRAIRDTALNAELKKRMDAAKAAAQIKYQSGFGPASPAAPATQK